MLVNRLNSKELRVVCLFLFVILFTSTFQVVNATALLSFEDDFEKYCVDSFPSSGGWELWFDGAGAEQQVIVNNISYSRSNSLMLRGLDYWAGFAAKPFTSSSPIIGFEVAVCVSSVNGGERDNARVAFTTKLGSSLSGICNRSIPRFWSYYIRRANSSRL